MTPERAWAPLSREERKLLRAAIACDDNCVEAHPVESARWCGH